VEAATQALNAPSEWLAPRRMNAVLLRGSELVNAVGESFRQPVLREISGAEAGEPVSFECIAALVPDFENPHDSNAVEVQVDARHVAYLSRGDAHSYRPAIARAAEKERVVICGARICGRGKEGRTPNLGVFLQMPSPDRALEQVIDAA
jgi:hypothetical protein